MESTNNCSNLNSKKRKLSDSCINEGKNYSIDFDEFEAMKAENEKLKHLIEKQNATIIDLAMDNTELKKEKLNQSKIIAEHESEFARLKPIVDDSEKKVSMLEQKESQFKAAIVKQKARIICMKYELTSIQVVSNQIQSNQKRIYESKINQLESTVKNLTKKNIALNQSVQDERKKYKTIINGIKSEVEEEDIVMKENLIPVNDFGKKMNEKEERKSLENIKVEAI